MGEEQIIEWLLKGDVSIQYQVYRDLLGNKRKELQNRITNEGWGMQFLTKRHPNGHWGKNFYQPKWTSTHYTLLDLKNLCVTQNHPLIQESINIVLKNEKANDGGILPIGKSGLSDLCINGMFLNYASYFRTNEEALKSVVDYILAQVMPDGGFNCRSNRFNTVHSSLHTTLSILEGINEYDINNYKYRLQELRIARDLAIEFILIHQLFISDRTGEIINKDFLKLTYPRRWRYDILSALDCFQHGEVEWDERMGPSIQVLAKKRNKDSTWNIQA
tara:strand:+ start:2748 stop:3572 length:825 start_codon:yes stop_codon:yes gene_type:complete